MHILVVEDEQRLAFLLRRVLLEERHTVNLALASIPDEGTTVTLVLPLVHGAPPRPGDAPGGISSLPERTF